MKISARWLKRYVDLGISDGELGEIFTSIGLEVDAVEKVGVSSQETLVVGEVLEIEQHPNADKLALCTVRVGENDARKIVCGARNFKVNDHVPVALPGTVLPGDFRIEKSNLRGVDSDGMMCSSRELGMGDDHAGLLILDKSTRVGRRLHDEIVVPDDTVFDISLTANRGDCLSHIGVARDVAARLNIPLKFPTIKGVEVSSTHPTDHFLDEISIETGDCECYSAICVADIKIGESPDWMKRDLAAVGIRSINNAVDIGNWVMMETGQPVHIFDARKIIGNRLTIRLAVDGETVISLDSKRRMLNSSMMVICDGERPLVIAGVTGSIDAEVDGDTTDILIESAYFNANSIRQTAKALNISTESSHRFSRDIDTANVVRSCQRVADLVEEVCGGTVRSKCWVVGTPKRLESSIDFSPSLIEKLCGFPIAIDVGEGILTRLGFGVEKLDDDRWSITVPAHRPDIMCSADIVSECLRIYGTDKIPETPPKFYGIHGNSSRSVTFLQNSGNYLSNHGFLECCSLSLRNRFDTERVFGDDSAIAMHNPFSTDQSCFRVSLIPGLLETMALNIQNGNWETKFFETGRVVLKIGGKFNECLAVGFAMLPIPIERSWRNFVETDFYDVKALIFPILQSFSDRLPVFEDVESSNLWQPGYSASCGFLDRERFQATCGLLGINFVKKFDVRQNVFAAEVIVHPSIFSKRPEKIAHRAFSQFPRVSKDISLIVDGDERGATVESNVLRFAKKNISEEIFIESVNVFDVYRGEGIPDGMKNIGITINYRSDRRTLTDAEVQTAFNSTQSDIEKLYKIRKQA
ncbi:MAG: phenylalanine--tRNA ligase subunit beta [Puniceicoccales bacterium]|jgi:phenylalanyl-tRNA synthetase beta chain|nr:phenylalanine--tRNA ligase subunit beta [Puniceicoccales bacterium]